MTYGCEGRWTALDEVELSAAVNGFWPAEARHLSASGIGETARGCFSSAGCFGCGTCGSRRDGLSLRGCRGRYETTGVGLFGRFFRTTVRHWHSSSCRRDMDHDENAAGEKECIVHAHPSRPALLPASCSAWFPLFAASPRLQVGNTGR